MRIAIWVLGVIVMLCFSAPLWLPQSPLATQPTAQFAPPAWDQWLGTDYLGRDVLVRVLYGGQQSLWMGFGACIVSGVLGIISGVLAASKRQVVSLIPSAFLQALLSLPPLIIALIVLTIIDKGEWQRIVAVGISQTVGVALLVRSALQRTWQEDYVLAAISMGATSGHIWWMHGWRDLRHLLGSYLAIVFGYCLLTIATLGFLGFNTDPSAPEWGSMLADGRNTFRIAPWAAIAPGFCIVVVVACVFHLSDRLSVRQ